MLFLFFAELVTYLLCFEIKVIVKTCVCFNLEFDYDFQQRSNKRLREKKWPAQEETWCKCKMCIYRSFSHAFACLPPEVHELSLFLVTWQLDGLEHSDAALLWADWSLRLKLPLKAVANAAVRRKNWTSNQIQCINSYFNAGLQANKWCLVKEGFFGGCFFFFGNVLMLMLSSFSANAFKVCVV